MELDEGPHEAVVELGEPAGGGEEVEHVKELVVHLGPEVCDGGRGERRAKRAVLELSWLLSRVEQGLV